MNRKVIPWYYIDWQSLMKSAVATTIIVCLCPCSGQSQQLGNYLPGLESGLLQDVHYQRVRRLWVNVEPVEFGLLITGTYPNSPVTKMKSLDGRIQGVSLEDGDVILAIDGKPTHSLAELSEAVSASGDSCEITVRDIHSGANQVWRAEPVWADVPMTTRAVAATFEAKPSKVYVLVIADTKDGSIGTSIKHSLEALQSLLKNQIANDRCEIRILSGNECAAQNILDAIRNWNSKPTDSLLVYYMGHGAYDPSFSNDPYGGQYLDLPDHDLLRKTVWDRMECEFARLRILVTDSCNVTSQKLPPVVQATVKEVKQVEMEGATPTEWLLLGHRGRLDVSAASKDQFAWYSEDIGGWFSSCLFPTITKQDSWIEVKDEVIPATDSVYQGKRTRSLGSPATLEKVTRDRLESQTHLTPRFLMTALNRDAQDPIGVDVKRVILQEVSRQLDAP